MLKYSAHCDKISNEYYMLWCDGGLYQVEPCEYADIFVQPKSVWSGVSEQPEFDPYPLMFAHSAISLLFVLSHPHSHTLHTYKQVYNSCA